MGPTHELVALGHGYGLCEAARWYPEHGLIFSDMTNGGVLRVPPGATEAEVVIPKRKAVGGLVAHAEGGLVVSGRNIAHVRDGVTTVLLERRADEQFFNDLGADARGRVFCGSMPLPGERDAGRFYVIDVAGSAHVLTDDLQIANGIWVDPADETLYSVDSGLRLVWRFALRDRPADIAASRELFVDTSEYDALPDGMAVAADGSVWVAMAGAGVVVGWDAAGTRLGEIPVPRALVTSVAFGGPRSDVLFILTGESAEHPHPDGGAVFRTVAPRPGCPSPYARVGLG